MIINHKWVISERNTECEDETVFALSTKLTNWPYTTHINLDSVDNFRFALYIRPNGELIPCWNVQDISLVRRNESLEAPHDESRLKEGNEYR